MFIIQDSREQQPFHFKISEIIEGVIVKKLDVGDYSLQGFEQEISFDRKNPSDFVSTMLGGHERFKQEMERAKGMHYFCIIVETSFTNIRDNKYPGAFHNSFKGAIALKVGMTLKMKYGVDLVFAADRTEATNIIKYTLQSYYSLRQQQVLTLPFSNKETGNCPLCSDPLYLCSCSF